LSSVSPTICGVALLACLGCSEAAPEVERIAVVPATGTIVIKSSPAAGARVRLHPVDTALAKRGLYPEGIADVAGKFALSTYVAGDGAPPGEYRVSVTWPDAAFQPKTGAQREALLEGAEKPDRLKGRYSDPAKSGLRMTIATTQPESLPPIELP
jgi:hypothetical protein